MALPAAAVDARIPFTTRQQSKSDRDKKSGDQSTADQALRYNTSTLKNAPDNTHTCGRMRKYGPGKKGHLHPAETNLL